MLVVYSVRWPASLGLLGCRYTAVVTCGHPRVWHSAAVVTMVKSGHPRVRHSVSCCLAKRVLLHSIPIPANAARDASFVDQSRTRALDIFISPNPISLLSCSIVGFFCVWHRQALQTSGEYEEAYDLCLMAQNVVDESVEKGDGMGPAHDPHVLWLQLAFSSFFLQRWPRALDGFTRIVEGVTQARKASKYDIYVYNHACRIHFKIER